MKMRERQPVLLESRMLKCTGLLVRGLGGGGRLLSAVKGMVGKSRASGLGECHVGRKASES